MSRALILLVSGMLLSCFSAAKPRIQDQKHTVVQVKCASGGWGTGFAVAKHGSFTVVATAKHVVDDGCDPVGGLTWKTHDFADVALVLYFDDSLEPVELSDPELGEEVVSWGYPGSPGVGLNVSRGNIAGPSYDGMMRLTAPIWFGYSGGPVFNERGEVVCMNTAIYMNIDGFAVCTPSHFIKDLL